jgi:hypothetical protein
MESVCICKGGCGMKNRVKLISLAMGIFTLFLTMTVFADDFSADMISTTQGKSFKGKIFINKDKIRMETAESITITRLDKKVVWMLMPKDKMYMEQPVDTSKTVATSEKISNEIERKLISREMIDGRMADKYQVVYNANGKRVAIFQWIVAGLKIPVKTAAVDGSWTMEYKNIKTGKQPDSLFEVPGDYQKFSVQMPSMKDIFKGLVK